MFCVFFKSVHYLHKECEKPKIEEVGEDDDANTVKKAEEVGDDDDDPGANSACLDDELAKDSRSPVTKLSRKAVAKDPEMEVARLLRKPERAVA